MILIYACEGCGFLFQRVSEVRECPSCESGQIRPASEEEKETLQQYLKKQIILERS